MQVDKQLEDLGEYFWWRGIKIGEWWPQAQVFFFRADFKDFVQGGFKQVYRAVDLRGLFEWIFIKRPAVYNGFWARV